MKMILLTEGETMSRLFDLDWQLLADSCLMIIAIFVLFLALSYFLFNPASGCSLFFSRAAAICIMASIGKSL